jgi:predicted amidohydrolase YtcJ
LVLRASLLIDEKRSAKAASPRAVKHEPAGALRERARQSDPQLADLTQALRELHLLLRAHRLYDSAHPRVLDSLDAAYDSLKRAATDFDG